MNVQLGNLKKKSKPKAGKKEYPTLPDPDGSVAKSVAILCNAKAKLDQLKGTISTHEAELKALARNETFKGREAPGTIKAYSENGASVSLSLQNRYYPFDMTVEGTDGEEVENPRITALRAAMGSKYDKYMEEDVVISIDLNKFHPDYRQEIVDSIISIGEMYDGDGIEAKQLVRPRPSFHMDRCTEFSEEQNHAINKQLPVTVSLRAKGVQ